MPTEKNIKASSSGSFIGVLNLTIESAPTNPRDNANDDLITAMLLIMNTDDDFTGPVNIGNPDEFTIQEIAEKIVELTNSSSQIVFKQLPEDDPKQRKPDISIAKEKINWEPEISLINGLKQTIDYFERVL